MSKLENKSGMLIGSGVIAGFIASLCCIGPLVLTILGVSGAAVLAKFEVIRIPMTIAVIALFGMAGFSLYRKRKTCEPGSICADPKKFRKMVLVFWIGLAIALVEVTSPQWVMCLFG